MAVVTITITDDEVGGAQAVIASTPDYVDGEDPTPAQVSGALLIKVLHELIEYAKSETEGKGE